LTPQNPNPLRVREIRYQVVWGKQIVIGARAVGVLILSSLLTLPLAGQHPGGGGNTPPHPQQQKSVAAKSNPQKLGAWLRTHKDLPLDQQEKALENDPAFKRLSPQSQAQLKERLHKFNNLPAEQKEKALRNMEYWEKLTQQQKDQIRQAHQHMETLPTERKVMVRRALRHLRQMSPNERQQEFQSEQFKSTFSDQEQTILKNLAEINPPAQSPTPNENATPR
jgi:molecular chaperone DnaK (HSP70)